MRFIFRRAAKIGLVALMASVFGPMNNVVAQNLDLDSFLAPVQGGSEAVQGDVEVGDTVHAETMQDGLNAANGLLAEDGDGVLLVSTKTGLGTIARASASYNTYQNINATMLSKRGAYFRAYQEAKRQLLVNFDGVQNSCEGAVNDDLVVIDTGVESTANTLTETSEVCKETISGLLAAFVVFDVDDNVNEQEVSISVASSTKTRSAFSRLGEAVIQTGDPNAAFQNLMVEIARFATPPMGARMITAPDTGEQVVVGFGSSIIRTNKNKSVAKRLAKAAKSNADTRARNALVQFLQGDKLYWEGGFDESQIEGSEQFTIPVDEEGNVGDPQVLDNERNVFLNVLTDSQAYSTVAAGKVPPGVRTRSFKSEDGYWQFSVAVFQQSATAQARQASRENKDASGKLDQMEAQQGSGGSAGRASRALKLEGGLTSGGLNPQGPSGQVSDKDDF
ncbi:MAG: hypothetical protein ACPG7P_05010 [Candidatus Puniceispirillaceae bacterium]